MATTAESRRSLSNRTLKLHSGSCYLPHPDKEKTGGEDAHFICSDEQAIGVADGVGGWAEVGINAGEYACELMSNSMDAIKNEPGEFIDPARVLEKAHSETNAVGSSTACIIVLKDQVLLTSYQKYLSMHTYSSCTTSFENIAPTCMQQNGCSNIFNLDVTTFDW